MRPLATRKLTLVEHLRMHMSKECQDAATEIEVLRDALRIFVGSAYPVAEEINKRGYNWSEAYLDEARVIALAALSGPLAERE